MKTIRPTPRPGDIWQHCNGKCVVIYAIVQRTEQNLGFKPITVLSPEDETGLLFIQLSEGRYFHTNPDLNDVVVYGCSDRLWYRSTDNFLATLSNGQPSNSATYFYRFEKRLSQREAEFIAKEIDRYNRFNLWSLPNLSL